ncbi:MAG: hypothetical protein E6J69_17395 [Deltaproteobacteria bacterium]|nr:MAG: hypothetical protein E6J69_17395 [Deltaproteobacteria bacterium]
MRRHSIVLALLLAAGLGGPPARAGDATGAFAPYEDLLEVLGDLTWHLRDDLYRFPPPKDPTGHDLYRLALSRLENWEKRYPGRLRDVVGYARAEALERLGEYAKAADGYGRVAAERSPLADQARTARERAAGFAEAAALPEDGPDVDVTLAALRRKLDAWGRLVEHWTGTPYETPALVEEERLERAAASVVVRNRTIVQDGNLTAERALRFLVQKHADSRNLPDHILRLGDLYADVARDYVEQHERPLAFEEDEFVQRADRALEMYRKVATWDGAREKPEAQGRFAAFDAYKTSVLARYR